MKGAAKGVIFGVEDSGTPGTYIPVAHVANLDGPGLSSEPIDVSAHDSPDFYMEFVNGFRNPGELSLELRWDPADATHGTGTDGLLTFFDEDAPRNCEITWPDAGGTKWQFAAIVTGYEPTAPHDGVLGANVSLQLTGKPDFAAT